MKNYLGLITLLIGLSTQAQPPEGYYDDAEGLDGQELREALRDIIDGHDVQSYSSLWTHFQVTDSTADGEVWDMYSDVPGGEADYYYSFVIDQCGNYSQEGDCYNREHSFPKSWFGGNVPPMYTDMFHLVPSDGYTNGQRGNYPYGETDSPSWTSSNGSKRGTSSYPGYSGIVFEPIDEYKGDFARNYFYMLTRYMDQIEDWDSPMLDNDDFSSWAKSLLLEWAYADTVSQKEIDRNNEIYEIQDNRNPFIDRPEFMSLIWDPSASIGSAKAIDFHAWYSNGKLIIKKDHSLNYELQVIDIQGRILMTASVNGSQWQQELPLNNGIYIITLNRNNQRSSKKIAVITSY